MTDMKKPRDFWIFETGFSAGDSGSEACIWTDKADYEKWKVETGEDAIHVREVGTLSHKDQIDWDDRITEEKAVLEAKLRIAKEALEGIRAHGCESIPGKPCLPCVAHTGLLKILEKLK